MELESSFKEHLYRMEERLLQPEFRSSYDDLANLIADDFIEFGSSGRVYYKQQVLGLLQKAPSERMTLKDFQVKSLAQGVVLTTYQVVKHNEPNEQMRTTLRSSVWKFIDERWQIVFHQGTPTRESKWPKNNYA